MSLGSFLKRPCVPRHLVNDETKINDFTNLIEVIGRNLERPRKHDPVERACAHGWLEKNATESVVPGIVQI